MKITMTRFNKEDKVLFTKAGALNSKATIRNDLIKTLLIAYNGMLNNPDCDNVTIILRKEVK